MIEYLNSVCDDDVDEDEVRSIFKCLDVSGDRTIDFWEFEVSKHSMMLPFLMHIGYCINSGSDAENQERRMEKSSQTT